MGLECFGELGLGALVSGLFFGQERGEGVECGDVVDAGEGDVCVLEGYGVDGLLLGVGLVVRHVVGM